MQTKVKRIDNKDYYEDMINCLERDGLYEELAYVRIAVEMVLRKGEMSKIKWGQLLFPYIKNITILKTGRTKSDFTITKETNDAILKLQHGTDDEYIFYKDPEVYRKNISQSIGDEHFSLHKLRDIGMSVTHNDISVEI